MSSSRRVPIELVCFDMAGTTVADGGAVEEAFLSALDVMGIRADDPKRPAMLDYVRTTMGTSKITVFRALFGDDALAAEANVAFEQAYGSVVEAGRIAPIGGAAEAIGALRASGRKVALLTGFSARTRDIILDALGWNEIADLVLCPADAGRGRPFPDMILTALLRLEASDVAAVAVVGDTASDIESGLRSGASIVAGVLTGADDEDRLAGAGATQIIASVADLPALLAL
jgi:phosphonatase-like hydrolase